MNGNLSMNVSERKNLKKTTVGHLKIIYLYCW